MAKESTAKKTTVPSTKPAAMQPPTKDEPKTEQKSNAKAVGKICPAGMLSTSYKMGTAKYNPRVEHTAAAWDKVKQFITVKGKGQATHAELCGVLEQHSTKLTENHHDFIGYMVRRGTLAIIPAAK